jgi:ferredoxin
MTTERDRQPWRLHIDWTRCEGRGLCIELLAGTLARDDWGFPRARDHGDPAIGRYQLAAARDAVALCPRLALTLRK